MLAERDGRSRVKPRGIVYGETILKPFDRELPPVHLEQCHGTDKSAGGTEFVVVLEKQEIGAGTVHTRQVRRQRKCTQFRYAPLLQAIESVCGSTFLRY